MPLLKFPKSFPQNKLPKRQQQLSSGYYTAIVIISVLSLFALFTTQYVLKQQGRYAGLINKSGRQCMLSQQTTLLLLHLSSLPVADVKQAREVRIKLTDSLDLMEASHWELTQRTASRTGNSSLSPVVSRMYFEKPLQVDVLVTSHISTIRSILENPQKDITDQFILTTYTTLLSALDAVVQQYERESNIYTTTLKRIGWIVCVSTLIVLILLIQCIFVPLVKAAINNEAVLIEERQEAERLLVHAKEAAEHAGRMKSEFLASLSHELKTPMNAIIGLTHLTLETEITGKQRAYLNKISSSAGHLVSLIDELLDFSKMSTNQVTLKNEPFNLTDVMDDLASVITCPALEKGLEVNFSIDQDVPFRLVGDKQRLEQVLGYLVSNAVKFTDKGHVDVTTQFLSQDKEQVTLRFMVNDTGKGVAPDQVDQLFVPFTQGDNSNARQHGGIGLGLAICNDLVGLMNGTIQLENKSGPGALFVCEIPFSCDSGQSQEYPVIPELFDLKVLIVDDHAMARRTLEYMLQSFHVKTKSVTTAKDALFELEESKKAGAPYDFMLTDWQMPEMDGVEAVHEIRRNPAVYGSPVTILITAFSKAEAVRRAEADFDGLLLKPVNRAVLLGTLLTSQHVKDGEGTVSVGVTSELILPDKLPGLDLKKGQALVGGNQHFYILLLKKFCRNQADQADAIWQARQRGESETVYRLLHTLKGVAGNIGANELYDRVLALEHEFVQNDVVDDSVFLKKFEPVKEGLLEVHESINTLVSKRETTASREMAFEEQEINQALLEPILEQLDTLLLDSDTDAEKVAEQLAELCNHKRFRDKIVVLQDQIGQYEFDEARETVHDIRVILKT
jgi:signal transduction histidine kinase/YesN/AraC family two-component response regulator